MKNSAVNAFIFDMDGTMVGSMPTHTRAWVAFAQQHGIDVEASDLMRRITGLNGAQCMRELFGRDMDDDEAWALNQHKEQLYRELFAPVFAEVAGFKRFAALAHAKGLKLGVGSAGDRHNIAFALQHLNLAHPLHAVVGGDQGLPGKPDPAIFLEASRAMDTRASSTIVFEDAPFGIEAARRAGMRAVAVCSSHSALELAGPHVLASVRDYNELLTTNFLETLHVATT